ncbi:Uncharacterised protein [Mycobacterium tuberculosis]|uniref:Uncharacterized protein n=1 Tax=Mycobacterium tuberculosis TaxID=1773 RepID=A0A655JQP2_MYCTX|nr:Uncharacterised protein [Mycobacterium tuberculosis]CKV09108.1 Uncharacterised protein [Mycobacterium tuberculosis]COW81634.1 Uncharacterised protein [Mycobacterium tuberculosis]COX13703.1 Uncharacterised protein [Mycobacterium tuberculosis]COX40289.1 Uncharacterised protein [Mycobacterium tuberculosis]
MCAKDHDLLCRGCRFGSHNRQLQRGDVLDESAQGRTRGAGHVMVGDVEQGGHRFQVPGGLDSRRTTMLAGRQPAALQTRPLPGSP